MPELIPVTFGFSTSEAFMSRLIRWFTKEPASHCYLRYVDPWGIDVILEATWPVVMERPAKQVLPSRVIVDEITLLIPKENLMKARERMGNWYDTGNLFMLGGMFILNWLSIKWTNWKSNPREDVCSDLHIRALDWKGIEKTTPWDIRNAIILGIAGGSLQAVV